MRKGRVLVSIILLLILSSSLLLRFYGLKSKGLVMFDEAWYLLETRFFLNLLKGDEYLKLLSACPPSMDRELRLQDFGFPLRSYKPGHLLLMTILSLIIGLRDYTGLFLSAIAGVVTIYLTYLLGRFLYNEKTGVLASFLLAFMPYHIFYSRSGFAEMDSTLFFLLALLIYLAKRSTLGLVLSGLTFGFSITCNFRMSIFLLLFILSEWHIFMKEWRGLGLLIMRLLLFILSLLLPILIFELYSIALHSSYPILRDFPTYLGSLKVMLNKNRPIPPDPFPFLLFLLRLVGPIYCLLFIIGMILLLRRHTFKDLFIVGVFLIPFILYSFITSFTTGPRTLCPSLPAIAIIIACGILNIVTRFRLQHCLMVLVLLFGLFINGFEGYRILRLKSGYKEAVQYIIDHGSPKYLTTSRVKSVFYHTSQYSLWAPYNLEELKWFHNMGCGYLLLDQRKYTKRDRIAFVKLIQNIATPCHEVPNNVGRYWVHFYDDGLGDMVDEILDDESFGKILIYDLGKIFEVKG